MLLRVLSGSGSELPSLGRLGDEGLHTHNEKHVAHMQPSPNTSVTQPYTIGHHNCQNDCTKEPGLPKSSYCGPEATQTSGLRCKVCAPEYELGLYTFECGA